MANVCTNEFYAYSESKENIKYIYDSLSKWFYCDIYDSSDEEIYANLESKWVFPEEFMDELYDNIPDKKSEFYMRCLSYEYGCMYHDLLYCDNDTRWRSA